MERTLSIDLLNNVKTISTSDVKDVSMFNRHSFQVMIPGTSGAVKIETSNDDTQYFWAQLSGDFETANSTGIMFYNGALKYIRARNNEVADSGVHVRYFGNNV